MLDGIGKYLRSHRQRQLLLKLPFYNLYVSHNVTVFLYKSRLFGSRSDKSQILFAKIGINPESAKKTSNNVSMRQKMSVYIFLMKKGERGTQKAPIRNGCLFLVRDKQSLFCYFVNVIV